MRKQSFLRLIIFLFSAQATFVIYNNPNIYAADVTDVVTVSKDMRAGYEEMRKGNLDRAIDIFNKVISMDAKNSNAYAGLGNTYFQKGESDKAIELFNKVISLDAENPRAYIGLGNIYFQKG
ncbi:MAG: tetratricopeptide repeat protein, partial [Candidatus Omnitrophota bacterium]